MLYTVQAENAPFKEMKPEPRISLQVSFTTTQRRIWTHMGQAHSCQFTVGASVQLPIDHEHTVELI